MKRETTSFQELYRSYAGDVYRFSLWLCGDTDLARDITSETFTRLWMSRNRLKLETVKGYLLTIARNIYLKQQRKAGRFDPLPEVIADMEPDPEMQTAIRSDMQHTLAALRQLPVSDRAALIMRAQEQLPYSEIARSLGISIAAAKVKVHRSRKKLNQLVFSGEENPYEDH